MLSVNEYLCTECGACVPVCHVEALRLTVAGLKIDRELCDLCNICVKVCPTQALQIVSETFEQV